MGNTLYNPNNEAHPNLSSWLKYVFFASQPLGLDEYFFFGNTRCIRKIQFNEQSLLFDSFGIRKLLEDYKPVDVFLFILLNKILKPYFAP